MAKDGFCIQVNFSCVGQAGFMCTTHNLSADEICIYIPRVGFHTASFGIWHLLQE